MTPAPLLLLLLLLLPGFSSASSQSLEKACNQTLYADFCTTSLQADPQSESADLAGLAAIALDLSVANATSTTSKLEALRKNATDPGATNTLDACLILYRNSFPPLRFASEFAAAKHFDAAYAMYEAPIFAPSSCKGASGNLLAAENDNFFYLMLIARTFTQLLKSSSSSSL